MSAGPDADGLIGEAWSGEAPNGSHVNLVIARRGSPTAAAAAGALCSPAPATCRSSAASARGWSCARPRS